MSTTLKFRRGSTSDLSVLTGAQGELFVDTDKNTLVVNDGSTAGGIPLAKASELPTTLTQLGITDGTNGQVLTTNGSGGFTFTTVSGYGNTNVATYLSSVTELQLGVDYGGFIPVGVQLNPTSNPYGLTLTGCSAVILNSLSGNTFIQQGGITFGDSNGNISFGDTSASSVVISQYGITSTGPGSTYSTVNYSGFSTTGTVSGLYVRTDNYQYANGAAVSFGGSGGGGGSTYTEGAGINIDSSNVISTDLVAGSGVSITESGGQLTIAATGAANTGDFSFSGGNITLPDFEDATINVSGNVTTSTSAASTVTYLKSQGLWYSDGGYNFVYDSTTVYYENSSSSSAFGQILATIPVGTVLTIVSGMYGTSYKVTLTSAFAYSMMYMHWEASVSESNMMGDNSCNSISYATTTTTETTAQQDFTYTFSQTGEFISDSALLGDVLVSDNILTPLPLISNDSYKTETDQPIIINGDLEILGNVTSNLTVTGLFTSQQSAETVANVTTATNSSGVTLNFNSGAIFYFNSRSSSVSTLKFTNIPKVANQVVTVTVIIKQDGTGFMPSYFYVNGTSISGIYWSGGSAPSATASTIDVLSFSIMWVTGTTYTIFASASNYATA